MLHELDDDNYKSTFDCTLYYRATGIAILRHTISYLSACCCNKVKEVIKITVLKEGLQSVCKQTLCLHFEILYL